MQHYMTAEGKTALEAELAELVKIARPAVAQRIAEAIELGDISENADYEIAKNEQAFIEGRIGELEALIRDAVLIETDTNSETVIMGSKVTVNSAFGREEFTIVGPTEADPAKGRISFASPIGKSLMGARAGDTIAVMAPAGETGYTVVSIA